MVTLPRAPARTTPAFCFSDLDRAFADCLGYRRFGKVEQNQVLEFFRQLEVHPSCVFCGIHEVKRWDHLFALSRGGETVLGNMVLACAECDDAKRDRPFGEWMVSSIPTSPLSRGVQNIEGRIERINTYVHFYKYEPKPLKSRLNEDELARLNKIRSALKLVQEEVDSLIRDYRTRTGFR